MTIIQLFDSGSFLLRKRSLLLFCVLLVSLNLSAQESITVKGVVTSVSDGAPLPGVSILVKGTNRGTVSGFDGDYAITVSASDVLVFSYLGYKGQELVVGNKVFIDVALQENLNSLDEIVVIGYGTSKKSDLTGSVASIKGTEVNESNPISPLEGLAGRVAGLQIDVGSGEPGAYVDVVIRGANSINATTTPLYVIDGVQIDSDANEIPTSTVDNNLSFNPLATINPNDIESVDVLKDASATAIYGSRGANGVIIITTKTGKTGKPVFTYSSNYTYSEPSKRVNMLSADDYIFYRNEVLNRELVDEDGNLLVFPENQKHNWEKEGLGLAISKSHNISVRGGNEALRYSLGVGYLDSEGVLLNNELSRLSSNLRLDFKLNEKISVQFSNALSTLENSGLRSGGGFNGVIRSLLWSIPLDIIDEESGQFNRSPLDNLNFVDRTTRSLRNLTNLSVSYKINKNLTYKINGTINNTNAKGSEFFNLGSRIGNIQNGRGILRYINSENYALFNRIDYQFKINKNHDFKLLLGTEMHSSSREESVLDVVDFPETNNGTDNIELGSSVNNFNSRLLKRNRLSFLGRLNYNYKKKYLLTASLRRDGSDVFASKNRFRNFPSAAIAWKVDRENFLKNVKFISNLKFRIGYGETGNERIPSNARFAILGETYGTYNNQEVLGNIPRQPLNGDLDWEITTQGNLGIDLGLFNQDVAITLDLYKKETKPMLLDALLPAQGGYFRSLRNTGSTENKGFELAISTHNINKRKFKWTTNFSISRNLNEITSLGDSEFIPLDNGRDLLTNIGRLEVGQPIGMFYGFEWIGIYQTEDFSDLDNFVLQPGLPTQAQTVRPGSLKFKDQLTVDTNGDGLPDVGDGVIDDNDRTYIGDSNPDFFGGIRNSFKIGNLDLSFFLEYKVGFDVFNITKYNLGGRNLFNVRQELFDNRWTEDNPTNEYPTFIRNAVNSNLPSSYYVEDGSYIRLANFTIGYNFPNSVLEQIGIQSFRVYATGTNLALWTDYSGYDPDVGSGNRPGNLIRGVDRAAYPRTRSIILGLKLSF